jgi:hypothetical protein
MRLPLSVPTYNRRRDANPLSDVSRVHKRQDMDSIQTNAYPNFSASDCAK